MSASTLLRIGLWTIFISLTSYVLRETFSDTTFAEVVNADRLEKAALAGAALIIAGVVVSIFEKLGRRRVKGRCNVCKKPVFPGEFFCREHLRRILADEDHLTHSTRAPRR